MRHFFNGDLPSNSTTQNQPKHLQTNLFQTDFAVYLSVSVLSLPCGVVYSIWYCSMLLVIRLFCWHHSLYFCFSQFEGEKREEDIDKQDMIDSRQLQHSMLTGQFSVHIYTQLVLLWQLFTVVSIYLYTTNFTVAALASFHCDMNKI